MSKKHLVAVVLLLMVVLAACASPTPAPTQAPAQPPTKAPEPTAVPQPTAIPEPTKVPLEVPFEAQWVSSPHNDATAEAFKHWDEEDPKEVPASCATCHTTTGYQDYLGADGSEAGKVDKNQPIGQTVQCAACHNEKASTLTEVAFPGKDPDGNPLIAHNVGDSGRCMVCHQGRASKATVDAQIERFKITDVDAVVAPIKDDKGADVRFGFVNIHYFAAAATLYGTEVKGGYEYEGKTYDAKNTHVDGYAECAACHSPHTLEVKVDECAVCHEGVKTADDLKNVRMVSSNPDYDGDGDVKEGMAFEIEGLQAALLAEIQKYAKDKAGAGIAYDAATYPYFLLDANGDGAGDKNDQGGAVGFNKWTARLLKAAYNYQVSVKDAGAFAHGNKYIVQLLFDSIEDLGGDVSKLARTDAGHFAGDTMPFRDWDGEEYTVPYRCVKCHTAEGLPTFLKNGGTVVVDGRGSTLIAGVGAMPSSNGFMCTTCHNEEKFPELYAVASVTFPSGKTVSFAKDADGKLVADPSNLCLQCHQGRESTLSVNNALRGKEDDTADKAISFKNIHYLGAGATVFGADAAGAYQYADKQYLGLNPHPANKCKDCHDVHALKVDEEKCAACHSGAKLDEVRAPGDTTDYDGDGNTTEGTHGEVETMAEKLYAAMQDYAKNKAGAGLVYNSAAYPYFFLDADGDGTADKNDQGANVSYNAWTPRLLRAAFNYQYVQKDPGAFVHNPKYVFQFLYDSVQDLGGDVKGMTRPAVPAQ